MNADIFANKIKLSAVLVDKELRLIEVFNGLIDLLQQRPEMKEELNDFPLYFAVWKNTKDLYDFLKHEYTTKLPKKEKEKLDGIMKYYEDFLEYDLDDLKTAKDLILKTMSINKFHDVLRGSGGEGFDDTDF